jgi:hypothetical protein
MRMRPARAGSLSGRGLVLLPAGALLVHQLRYWLAYGSQAGNELGVQGHAYLGSLVPWIAMIAGGGLSCFVARLARAWSSGADDDTARPFLRIWATTGAGLIAIYSLQELLEGFLANGHPTGLAGIFGHGGWWSVPAATAVSLAVALLLRVGRAIVRIAVSAKRAAARRAGTAVHALPAAPLLVAGPPLAYAAAGRAPPARRAG